MEVLVDGTMALLPSNQLVPLVTLGGSRITDAVTGTRYSVVVREVEVDCLTCKGFGECCYSGTYDRPSGLRRNSDHNGFHDTHGPECISCGGSGARMVHEVELEPLYDDDAELFEWEEPAF